MADNTLKFKAVMDDKVSSSLDRIRGKFDTLGKAGGFKAFAQGIGVGAGIAAWNLLGNAVSGAVDFMGDAVRAAMEDQASQQRLRTALQDNVQAWAGNTAAIEKVLKARIDLGFSDDEQRTSLATLVQSTHDATEAIDLERGAMDIARARGVDLATAADAVAKAYAGNTKSLKSLIPGLDLGTSSAEALANAFETVKGQADAYADTAEGKLLTAQTKVNEKMEDLGYKLLPFVEFALGAVDNALGALDGSGADVAFTIDDLSDRLHHMRGETTDAEVSAADLRETMHILAKTSLKPITDDAADLEEQLRDAKRAADAALDSILDAVYGPTERRGREAGLLLDIKDVKQEIKEAKKAGDNLRVIELQGQLAGLERQLDEVRVAEQRVGEKPIKTDILGWLTKLSGKVKGVERAYISAAAAAALVGSSPTSKPKKGGKAIGGNAEGGWVGLNGPELSWVGEKGPEYIIPNHDLSKVGGRGGMGGARIIQLVVSGKVLAEIVDRENHARLQRAPATIGRV